MLYDTPLYSRIKCNTCRCSLCRATSARAEPVSNANHRLLQAQLRELAPPTVLSQSNQHIGMKLSAKQSLAYVVSGTLYAADMQCCLHLQKLLELSFRQLPQLKRSPAWQAARPPAQVVACLPRRCCCCLGSPCTWFRRWTAPAGHCPLPCMLRLALCTPPAQDDATLMRRKH